MDILIQSLDLNILTQGIFSTCLWTGRVAITVSTLSVKFIKYFLLWYLFKF
jgi:hypothetical protein